ncbi:MAG: hypothetical protein PXY39_05930 [archaeon]|nr:hypothetical protein [archaeon]
MQTERRKQFSLEYIEKELDKLEKTIDPQVKIYVAGGYVMAYQELKAGTKDIDVIVETRYQAEILAKGLMATGYRLLPNGTLTKEYHALGATAYENADGFRWEIFKKVVANKLALSAGMKTRSKVIRKGDKLQVSILSNEDIFLMKGVTDRDRDLEDISLLARSGVNYESVFKECLSQSDRTGKLWEIGLHDKCEELEEKYGVRVPITKKLQKIAEEKMLTKRIVPVLRQGPKSEEELIQLLNEKLKSSDIKAGLKILKEQARIRISKRGKISLAS